MVKGHKRRAIAGLTAFAASAIVAGGAVWACADDSCSAEWRLASPSFACGNQAMLNPGNDTRVNMLLLMRSLMPPRGGEAQATPANDDRQFGRTFMSRIRRSMRSRRRWRRIARSRRASATRSARCGSR